MTGDHVTFLTFLLKNLLRRKVRSLLTVAGVAIAVCTLVTLRGVARGFEESLASNFTEKRVDIVVSQKGVAVFDSEIDEAVGERIRKLPGVEAVTYSLNQMLDVRRGRGSVPAQVIGWPVGKPWFPDSADYRTLDITAGRWIRPEERDAVMIGKTLEGRVPKEIGDTIEVLDRPFTVVGVFDSPTVFERGAVVMRIDDMQELTGRAGRVTGFGVRVADATGSKVKVEEVVDAINGMKAEDGFPLRLSAQPSDEYVSNFSLIRMVDLMALVASGIAVAVASMDMLKTMIMTVTERVRDIGILRALGWRRGRVMRMILGEALLLSLLGACVGVPAALGLVWGVAQLPQASSFVSGQVAPVIMLQGLGLAILVGLLGGVLPAYRAASLPPTEALRHE